MFNLTFPFTVAELLFAYSLVFPPDVAQKMAEAPFETRDNQEVTGWGITSETLMLLSIASPELEVKVEKFITEHSPALDLANWRKQRDELRLQIEEQKRRKLE